MIASELVGEIRDLLASDGLSQRRIARLVGVSRGTVNAIARGKRPDYPTRRRQPADDFPEPIGPVRRCPGCGGRVHMPCLACHVRAIRRRP